MACGAKELDSFLSVQPQASDLTSQASVFTPVKWGLCMLTAGSRQLFSWIHSSVSAKVTVTGCPESGSE